MAKSWKPVFLEALAEHPNVTKAAAKAGVTRQAAYKARGGDTQAAQRFRDKWDDALKIGMGKLEDYALEEALNGNTALTIFLLKAHDPKKYRDNIDITSGGESMGVVLYLPDNGRDT